MCFPAVVKYMSNEDNSREQGVEFGPFADQLHSEEYPMDKEELLEEYGSEQIGLEEEGESLQEILGPVGETTYDSADEVFEDVLSNVSEEAIGRKNYSDRGDATGEQEREEESI